MWASASVILLWAIWYGWSVNNGDISYGRLDQIPWQEIQWYHALVSVILVVLTLKGFPVSTSFLVLSAFASTVVIEKILLKSMMGYAVAAVFAYGIWWIITKILDESDPVKPHHRKWWYIAQWSITAFLWWTWLSHDMANIAVFLPRQVPFDLMIVISLMFVAGLGWMFYAGGGKIQKIVQEKHNTRYVRSACFVDLFYLVVLFFFKEMNNIPMSTTFVFLGLLCGRELAIATFTGETNFKKVFPLVKNDFFKIITGLTVSMIIIFAVQYISHFYDV
jgi:hypothetical protein